MSVDEIAEMPQQTAGEIAELLQHTVEKIAEMPQDAPSWTSFFSGMDILALRAVSRAHWNNQPNLGMG